MSERAQSKQMQQAEAAHRDATIAANLKELGSGE